MTDVSPVLLEVADGVATITLNRPDAMNSLDVATKEALLAAVRQVADDAAVRCVVLTGTGRAFCVGQDLKEHIEILHSESSDALFRTVDEHYNPIVTTWWGWPSPSSPPSTAWPRGRAPASPSPATCGSWPTRPASTSPSPTSPCRATPARASPSSDWSGGRRRSSCSTSRGRSRPRRRCHSASPRASCRPVSSPRPSRDLAARLAGGTHGRPRRDAAVRGVRRRAHLRGGRGVRVTRMTLTGATADHAAAVAAFIAKEKPVFEGR